MAFIFTGLSAFADEDTRKDPELSFYSSSVGILAGTALEAPLRNPPRTHAHSLHLIRQVHLPGG